MNTYYRVSTGQTSAAVDGPQCRVWSVRCCSGSSSAAQPRPAHRTITNRAITNSSRPCGYGRMKKKEKEKKCLLGHVRCATAATCCRPLERARPGRLRVHPRHSGLDCSRLLVEELSSDMILRCAGRPLSCPWFLCICMFNCRF